MEGNSSFILREILGVSCFMAAVIFALISMIKDGREHFLRVCALFLVGVVVLFANSAYTYFAAVFIIATAVTQLEFLQNLAAIIRGSKEYFDYQKETQSRKEVRHKIEQELIEEVAVEFEAEDKVPAVSNDKTVINSSESLMLNLSPQQMDYRSFAMVAYEFALNKLEERLGLSIDRYPRFIGKNSKFIEFDGVLETDAKLIVFEIKTSLRRVMPSRHLQEQVSRVVRGALELGMHKKKSVEVRLVYVVFDEFIEHGKEQMSKLESELHPMFGADYLKTELLTYADIGLGSFAEEIKTTRSATKTIDEKTAV